MLLIRKLLFHKALENIALNKNLLNRLLNLKNTDWGERVTVIAKDMREWEPSEKADILVSELLGSVGDNELSPECLDGAQRLLKGIFYNHLKN